MSRRPAQGQPEGQPEAKKFDIAAIRAQLAANKSRIEANLKHSSSSALQPSNTSSASTTTQKFNPSFSSSNGTGTGRSGGLHSLPPRPAGPAAMPPVPQMSAAVAERLEAARKRVEALSSKMKNPYISGSGSTAASAGIGSGGGAGSGSASGPVGVSSVALHPLLMGDTTKQDANEKNEKRALRDRYKPMAPKFSSVRANAVASAASVPAPVTPIITNPYAVTSSSSTEDKAAATGHAGPAPSAVTRRSRKMQFSAPGRYVKQGDALRNEAKMEALRQRIAEASRKAGLEGEFDTLERSLKRQPPPEVEWWDRALLPEGGTYDDIEGAIKHIMAEDSLVTHLVLHPIPIPAPCDKRVPERAMMLTKKEQRKMRRQRRKAELQDKQDRQKMGLLPPDPPKVKLSNMMKVLTTDAVQDPTKIEAKIRREVAQRAMKHEMDNQERKLTPEQRSAKNYQKLVEKERNGLYASVYKIKYLTNGRHKFKIRETAKHNLLSGLCLFHPSFAIVIVEGVDKKIKHYRQLMLHRIDWTEEARQLGEGEDDEDVDEDVNGGVKTQAKTAGQNGEEEVDMSENKCELIWEGEIPERTFKMFRARHAETDSKAKEWLTPKWEGMWDLAKRWIWAGEDL